MADFASKLRENPETAVNRSLLAYGFGYDIRIRSIERALFDYGRRRTPHHILRIVFRHRAWRNRGLGRTVRRRQELAADRFRTAQSARVRRFTVGWPFRRRFHPAAVARAGRVPAAEAGAVGRDGGAGDPLCRSRARLPYASRRDARQGPRRISPTDALPDGRIRETLDSMGCADIDLNRPPAPTCPGGQAARVSLARTLLTRPKGAGSPTKWTPDWMTTAPRKWRVSSPKRRRTAWRSFVSRHRPPDGRATRVMRLADGALTQSGNAEADGTATGSTSTG